MEPYYDDIFKTRNVTFTFTNKKKLQKRKKN